MSRVLKPSTGSAQVKFRGNRKTVGPGCSNSHFGNSSLKSEARNPKSERNPNPEARIRELAGRPAPDASVSAFGFPPLLRAREGLGLRISGLGRWPIPKMRIAANLGGLKIENCRGSCKSLAIWCLGSPIPLTPALSQRERENRRQRGSKWGVL